MLKFKIVLKGDIDDCDAKYTSFLVNELSVKTPFIVAQWSHNTIYGVVAKPFEEELKKVLPQIITNCDYELLEMK